MSSEVPPGIVPRPPFQLRSLPIPLRWEITRRHPYYQAFWQPARNHHRQECAGAAEQMLGLAGVTVLGAIGFTGEPIDPATEDLETGAVDSAWMTGAVQPLSLRAMAAILLAALPTEEVSAVGLLFMKMLEAKGDQHEFQRISLLADLQSLEGEVLDSYPDEPFVSVNPAASRRDLQDALATLLRQWKDERDLPTDRRQNVDSMRDCFRVWDAREGWTDGVYDVQHEQTLEAIASSLDLPVSTANDRYTKAFQMIIGHTYSRELWWRTMGAHKAVDFGVEEITRPMASPRRRPVPESRLGTTTENLQREQSPAFHEYNDGDLLIDIKDLIDDGKTNEEIISTLEMIDGPETIELLGWMRSRA